MGSVVVNGSKVNFQAPEGFAEGKQEGTYSPDGPWGHE